MKRIASCIFIPLCIALLVSCGQPQETEEVKEEVKVTSDLVQRAEDFVTLLAKGDFANAVKGFDSTMKDAMPEGELQKAWASLLGRVGAFKKQVSSREAKEMGFDVVFVTCEFEKGPVDVKVVFNQLKQISGLWFVPTT